MATSKRIIPPRILKSGVVEYHSVTSLPDDSIAMCSKVPDRIIPVIFVPGVMGSNLQSIATNATKSKAVWVVNSTKGVAWRWGFRGAEKRKSLLDPAKTEVYRGGDLPSGADTERNRRRTTPSRLGRSLTPELRPLAQMAGREPQRRRLHQDRAGIRQQRPAPAPDERTGCSCARY